VTRIGIVAALFALAAPAPASTAPAMTPFDWANRIADSEIQRHPAATTRWDYSGSVLDLAILKLGIAEADPALITYGTNSVTHLVGPDGTIRGYARDEYTLDTILPGRVLLLAYTREEESEMAADRRIPGLRTALATLRDQFRTHPRNAEGGFWHKRRYPNQMWLDGLYMAGPFLAEYARAFAEPSLADEAVRQLLLMDAHAFVPAQGLHRHAWDGARAQSWADHATGLSPQFWTRSIGWYAMALVDVLDALPADHPGRPKLLAILRRSADGWVRWQDPATGTWWQVTDAGSKPGNYLESSGSAMLTYALAKGVNRGYLDAARFAGPARRGFDGLVAQFIRQDGDDWSLTRVCQVAGLGYTNAAGRPRDGSFDYYVSEPVVDNDPKGTGAFIMAAVEAAGLPRR
jgi:unsaturated rhamnogalacturonyl hydrolase